MVWSYGETSLQIFYVYVLVVKRLYHRKVRQIGAVCALKPERGEFPLKAVERFSAYENPLLAVFFIVDMRVLELDFDKIYLVYIDKH